MGKGSGTGRKVETHVEFVISDETRDRHGTVIPIKSWEIKNYNKNGIVGYQHDVYGGWGEFQTQI